MAKSAIYLVNNSLADVPEDSTIPLGTVIRRFGQQVRQDGNAVTLCDKPGCPGYYMVHIVATLEPAAAADYKVTLQKDGIDVIGGAAELVGVPALAIAPFVISVMVKNACGGTSALSLKLTGGDAKAVNVTTTVERL